MPLGAPSLRPFLDALAGARAPTAPPPTDEPPYHSFQSAPAAAVQCATAIREAVRTLGLEIRVGLHVGEYKVSGPDVFGLAFHIGARVAAKARAGEVLVSSPVRDLMAKSEILFKDRGVHQLKGVPKRWRLYRVDG